jgi:uncharacterized protein (TIGR03546 family)
MYLLYKLLRNLVRAMVSQAAPWQIGLGVFLGTLVGFLPVWPVTHGYAPSPLGVGLLFVALVINLHLASFFLFLGIGALLAKALMGPATVIGGWCEPLARASADIPLLHFSLWGHTGYLGLTLFGLVAAPIFAGLMLTLVLWFRRTWLPKILEHRRLNTVGALANRPILVRVLCWFFGV